MYYIGLDVGGTKTAVSVGKIQDEAIEILGREETPTRQTPQETVEALAATVEKYRDTYGVRAVGISCGGPLDNATGVIVSPPNLPGWHGFCITDYMKQRFSLSARLENDANACALAEWKFGAGQGVQNMVFLTFGTGIGAGLILDGRLYGGANGNAGEVGHIRLQRRGPVGFGKEGSFEGFCSGGGIARLAVETARRKKEMPACIRAMGGYDKVTAKELSKAAFAGDAFAKGIFRRSGVMLGKGLSVIIDTLNPQRIVLGGVFMRSSALLVPAMQKEIEREALSVSRSVCSVVPAKLSENIGDYAALSVAAFLK